MQNFYDLTLPLKSLLNGVLACWYALCAWRAHVFGMLACFTCSRTWRAHVLGVLHEMAFLACFKKLACLACFRKLACLACFKILACLVCFKKIGVLGVLHMMACLEYLKLKKYYLDVFDQAVLMNCGLCWIK